MELFLWGPLDTASFGPIACYVCWRFLLHFTVLQNFPTRRTLSNLVKFAIYSGNSWDPEAEERRSRTLGEKVASVHVVVWDQLRNPLQSPFGNLPDFLAWRTPTQCLRNNSVRLGSCLRIWLSPADAVHSRCLLSPRLSFPLLPFAFADLFVQLPLRGAKPLLGLLPRRGPFSSV